MEYVFFGIVGLGLIAVFQSLISFAMFMLLLIALTGGLWLLDIVLLRKKRAAGSADPVAIEYAKSFFPVILAVFLVRSFLVEPFKIPSGSMMPSLLIGDFILVNKYTYGLRVPVLNTTFLEVNHPKIGEVMVFHYPKNPSLDYIKRVVGTPGDRVDYHNKQLTINGKLLNLSPAGNYEYVKPGFNYLVGDLQKEQLGEHEHIAMTLPQQPTYKPEQVEQFPLNENCRYDEEGFSCTVPAGHYFMMGDNRDDSNDSRYWGFVPESNIVGRAFFVWMSFDHLDRIGTVIK